MKKILKRIFLLVAMMLVIIMLAQIILFVANFRTRRHAESLLNSLHELKVGTSTFEDVQPILVAYRAGKIPLSSNCATGDVAYGIRISNDTIDALGTNYPLLLKAGVRPVGATAALSFKNGRLCEFRYAPSVLMLASQYPFKVGLTTAQLIKLDTETAVQAVNGDENYDINVFETLLRGFRESGVHLGLRVVVTPKATPSEYQHALTFDLSCFTSFRGCRTFCQMMPFVQRDAIQKYRTHGLPVPEGFVKENEYPACLK
jgi:hypothetical protein